MNNHFSEVLGLTIVTLLLDIANVQPWFVIIAASVTSLWGLYQLVKAIKKDFFDKPQKRRNSQ